MRALAHATPTEYSPAASVILERVPSDVRIRFSERIEPKASGIAVYGPDGNRVESGSARVDPADARLFGIGVNDGGRGTYAVSWQVVSSDDGHFTKGAYAFSVGEETAGSASLGQIQVQHVTTVPLAVTIGLELIGQAVIIGSLALFTLWRRAKKVDPTETRRAFRILLTVGAALVLVGAGSSLALKTFDLLQLRPGDFMETLRLYLSTVDGRYTLIRGVLAIGVLAASLFARDRAAGVAAALVLGMVLARARVSHAAASHVLPVFSVLITAAHLFFKELWIGGLIAAATAFRPYFMPLRRAFDKLMAVAFGGAAVTGAYMVWLHVKDPANFFSSQWGERFVVLLLVGGILFLTRMVDQYFVKDPAAGPGLRTEMLVGIALLFVTAFLIITTPPQDRRPVFLRSTENQAARVDLASHAFEPSMLLVTSEGVTDMVVSLTNEEKGIGPSVIETEKRFDGGFAFPLAALTPAGAWKIDVTGRRTGAYDAVATFRVDTHEIVAGLAGPNGRSFGSFDVFMIVAALGSALFAAFIYGRPIGPILLAMVLGIGLLPRQAWAHDYVQIGGGPVTDTFIDILIPIALFWSLWALVEFRSLLRSWLAPIALFVLLVSSVGSAHHLVFKSEFRRLCEKSGHFWMQSVPMRDGQALSSDTVTGCSLDAGLYHFGDEREYRYFLRPRGVSLELSVPPEVEIGVSTDMLLNISEAAEGRKVPATDIGAYHDRILHALIIGQDLATFSHIHTEDLGPITEEMRKTAAFPLRHAFPKAGRYAVVVDLVVGGHELSKTFFVEAKGEEGLSSAPPASAHPAKQVADFSGYSVTFTAPAAIRAGKPVKLRYDIRKDGRPVTDLEPYLAAAMHIGIVSSDLSRASHTHGEALMPGSVWFQQLFGRFARYHTHFAPDSFGPSVITPPLMTVFPAPGEYVVFGEFRHDGAVVVTRFPVSVQ